MTNKQLKNLKDRLWEGADQLRANSGLKSTEYATPILGLIFLRFAESKYAKFEAAINAEYERNKGTRAERDIHEIAVEKCGYYLPKEARFDYLLNQPESADLAKLTKNAMEQIEKYTSELADTLPKDIYYSVNSADDPLVLAKLFRVFKDIPTDVSLRIFGDWYLNLHFFWTLEFIKISAKRLSFSGFAKSAPMNCFKPSARFNALSEKPSIFKSALSGFGITIFFCRFAGQQL